MGLTLEDKLKGFPKVYYLNLIESVDRKMYMETQARKYSLEFIRFPVQNFYKNPVKFKSWKEFELDPTAPNCMANETNFQFAVVISYIRLLSHWYETTNDPYAIFCDDDINFFSIDYWTFTWQQFMEKLPGDWEGVQLIRMMKNISLGPNWKQNVDQNSPNFKMLKRRELPNAAGGSAYLIKREYASELLNRYYPNKEFDFTLKEDTKDLLPGISAVEDTILYKDTTYNIPLFVEDCQFKTTLKYTYPYLEITAEREDFYKKVHNGTQDLYTYFWKTYGPTTSLNSLMEKLI